MNVEADLVPGVDAEPLLEHLPDAEDGVWLRGVGQPDCQLVALGADVHHSTVHLMGVLVSVLFYEEEENLQPVVVQVLGPLPLVQVDDPPATICVPKIILKFSLNGRQANGNKPKEQMKKIKTRAVDPHLFFANPNPAILNEPSLIYRYANTASQVGYRRTRTSCRKKPSHT